jgi:heat shock protein HslJ
MAKRSWPSRALALACAVAACVVAAPAGAQESFPFEREMFLDAKRLPDSKRVPMLEIFEDGRATIDLWCKSGEGRAEVTGDAIKFTLGPMREEYCTPERLQRDEELAAWLTAVTNWRLAEEDVLVLIGPTELNYRLSTH